MKDLTPPDAILPDVVVPVSMLSQPGVFGGRPSGDCLRGDLMIRGGCVVGMRTGTADTTPRGMVMPGLTECHVHLDKCHTISRMQGVGGDLRAAIDAQRLDRAHWTHDDLMGRAARGLNELIAAGCTAVRSHVDWSHGPDAVMPPLAWHVLGELAEDMAAQHMPCNLPH